MEIDSLLFENWNHKKSIKKQLSSIKKPKQFLNLSFYTVVHVLIDENNEILINTEGLYNPIAYAFLTLDHIHAFTGKTS